MSERTTFALVVLVGRNRGPAVLKHVEGFAEHESALREKLGLACKVVEVPSIDFVPHEIRAWQPDVALLVCSFTDSVERVVATCARIRSQPHAPKLVYLDTYDQTSSPHFGVLGHVDRYLKSKMLRDPSGYLRAYEGGNPLSEFASRAYDCPLGQWSFGSELDPAQAHKLTPCWSFGIGRDFAKIIRLADRHGVSWGARVFDVNRRIGLNARDLDANHWYAGLRRASARALEGLGPKHRCTGASRVSRRQYLLEMALSKIVFSPFGWGEVCFRDYEAVAAGCLLIKPHIGHVRTSPDVFRDGQTYVSVRWDLADLHEKVAYYLANPGQALAIATQGQDALRAYFTGSRFVDDVREALGDMIGAGPAQARGALA